MRGVDGYVSPAAGSLRSCPSADRLGAGTTFGVCGRGGRTGGTSVDA
ncbi:hypothetical protein ACFWMU_26315 [Streptomyces sp. NPDC058357]